MAKKRQAAPALRSLKPFRSLLLLKVSDGGEASPRVAHLRNGLARLASDLSGAHEPINGVRSRDGELTSAFAVYIRDRRAPWTTDPAYIDREHHLIVVSGYKKWFAVFMSDGGLRERARTELAEGEVGTFDGLELVSSGTLNAVFVKGEAKTLWLSHVHRRTSLKADHKVLSGLSLQDALDPLGDQSYAFTAARCQSDVTGKRSAYGIAPRKSRFWFKPSKDWDEYRETVEVLLGQLEQSTTENAAPLPVLSVALDGHIDPASLGTAYEVSLLPPELVNPAEEAEADLEADDTPEFDFEVVDGKAPSLLVEVNAENQPPCRVSLTLDVDSRGRASWSVEPVPATAALPEPLNAVRRFSRRLNVSFDGGFAVSDGVIHSVRYRDLPFEGFLWADFRGFDICKEKPTPLNPRAIGRGDSLFSWIQSRWATGDLSWLEQEGWLACNDGSTEMADFVHLKDSAPARLTLIHVKGAKGDGATRGLSVAPYEIVISQAIKNLRHIDPQLATQEFSSRLGRQIQNAVWHNGVAARRQDMLAAITAHGANLGRRIVVVQPQTRQEARKAALVSPEGSKERHLVRQLHGLLLGAQRDCSGVGAEFTVIADAGS